MERWYRSDEWEMGLLNEHADSDGASRVSLTLPMLTARKLSESLNRRKREDQYQVLLAFEKWLARAANRADKLSASRRLSYLERLHGNKTDN